MPSKIQKEQRNISNKQKSMDFAEPSITQDASTKKDSLGRKIKRER